MEEPRRIALIDILASDDDFSYIENANLEEMEEEIKKALSLHHDRKNANVTIRIHSVIALRSTVEITVISLDEEPEKIEDSDFIDEVNDILLTKTMTSFAYVTLQVKNEHCCYIENELCLEEHN